MNFANLTQINLPVPPMLEAALGYNGHMRYVAFYWDAEADTVRYDDGATDEEADFEAFDLMVLHEKTAPALAEYDLGSDGEIPRHFLLLDRRERALYAGRIAQISETMRPGGVVNNEMWEPAGEPAEWARRGDAAEWLEAWLDRL